MALIINGKPYEVPGLTTKSWLDNPAWRLKAGEDRYTRRAPVSALVFHGTDGSSTTPTLLKPGSGPYVDPASKTIKYWNENTKSSGAHVWIGQDGTVFCLADLGSEATPHAGNGSVNDRSIGVEMYQAGKNTYYQAQIDAAVKFTDFITKTFPLIQRQLQWPYVNGEQPTRIGPRGYDKKDFYGIFGHREAADNRGRGDPGDAIYLALMNAGYEPYDTNKNTDKIAWMARQKMLGLVADGIPGMTTYSALLKSGKAFGKWVSRPDDDNFFLLPLAGGLLLAYLLWKKSR